MKPIQRKYPLKSIIIQVIFKNLFFTLNRCLSLIDLKGICTDTQMKHGAKCAFLNKGRHFVKWAWLNCYAEPLKADFGNRKIMPMFQPKVLLKFNYLSAY